MKLIEIIKKNGMLLVAGLAVIGFSSFKMIEKLNPPQSGWYEVTPDSQDPENKTKQVIGAFVSTSAPSGSCNLDNPTTDKPCQVLLDLSTFTESSPEHMTVQEAIDSYNASINESSGGNEDGYARQSNP